MRRGPASQSCRLVRDMCSPQPQPLVLEFAERASAPLVVELELPTDMLVLLLGKKIP
jgi:hypothetical protein